MSSLSVREFVKMTTNQRQNDNSSVDDDDDDDAEEEKEDEVEGSNNTISSLRSSGSSNMYTPIAPPPPTTPTATASTTVDGTMHSSGISSSSNHSVSSMHTTQPPILQSVESTGSRPGAYAVAPGNRITQLATSKSLFHHNSMTSSPSSNMAYMSSDNENRTLSTDEIIAMLQSSRTYGDDEVMAPPLLPPPPPPLSSDTSMNHIPNDTTGGGGDDDQNNADTELPLIHDHLSGRNNDDNTISQNNNETHSRPVVSSLSSSYRESSVPVAHLVPIEEENDDDDGGGGGAQTPILTILGTPYLEEGPPSTAHPNIHHHHGRYKAIRQHLQQNKVHYILFTLVASIVLSAGTLGLICGVTGSCSKGPSTGNGIDTTTEPPLLDQRSIDLINYINNITLSNRTIGYPPPTNAVLVNSISADIAAPAEELALQWLIEVDPWQLWANRTDHLLSIRQRYALQTLYAATTATGFPWANTSGWIHPQSAPQYYDECKWFGVNCTATIVSEMSSNANVVTSLILHDNRLHGTFPPDLGLLSGLTLVDLSFNLLCGSIPATIGQWQSIEHFDLHVKVDTNRICILNGTLPSTIGNWNGPTTIDWSGHALSGPLPESMSHWNVNRIQKFSMNWNRIGGTIPSFIVTWWNLTHIEMTYNQITGAIPEMIGNLRQLQQFDFLGNALNGTLPMSIENLTRIESFSVGENMLSGTIPDGISSRWTNLRYAGFYRNNFIDGKVPEGICSSNATRPLLWVQIDCNSTAVEDRCSCCDCAV